MSGAVSRVPRLWLNIESLIHFGRMHIDGHGVLSPAALERMRTPQYTEFRGCLRGSTNFGLG